MIEDLSGKNIWPALANASFSRIYHWIINTYKPDLRDENDEGEEKNN